MTQQSHYLAYKPEKTITENDTCIPMFTTVLFTIARAWRCPSTDEWIKKICIYSEILLSLTKIEFESVLRWMNLERIPNEVSQRKINIVHIYGN